MKIGIALPTYISGILRWAFLARWAEVAEEAGFSVIATLDRPNHDTWDPLTSLAAVAAVTERIRLATTVLLLPTRNEVIVAKQAAVIDRISEGRLDLGVGIGTRRDDFFTTGFKFEGRGGRFPNQIQTMRRIWSEARVTIDDGSGLGPAPIQKPGPPVWIGATTPGTIERATRIGDGLVISGGLSDLADLASMVDQVRGWASANGKPHFPIWRIAYVAVGNDSADLRDQSRQQMNRFYRESLWTDPDEMIQCVGPVAAVAELAARHAEAGIDCLILMPTMADMDQLTAIGGEVVPAYTRA